MQNTHLMNQSPYMIQLQNTASQARYLSTNRTDPSLIELFNQQQALQRDIKLIFLSSLNYRPNIKITTS